MSNMKDRAVISKGHHPKLVEIKPINGCRLRLVAVKDAIIYAFGCKGQGIKSLAAQHGCTWDEIEAIVRERVGNGRLAA